MHRQRWKSFCESTWTSAWFFLARTGALQGSLETELTKLTTSVSWLLGCNLDEEIDPTPDLLCTSGFGELWAAHALVHTILQVCAALFSARVGLQSPLAADSCGLLGLPSLTQHHKCFITEQFFHLSLSGITEDFVNHLNSANNCLISVKEFTDFPQVRVG